MDSPLLDRASASEDGAPGVPKPEQLDSNASECAHPQAKDESVAQSPREDETDPILEGQKADLRRWNGLVGSSFEAACRLRPDSVKRLGARGIPAEYRWEAWKAIVGVKERCRPRRFHELLLCETMWERLIAVDVPRSFPEEPVFTSAYRDSLQKVLHAYANLNPAVGYCQGMNFVAGLLLIVSGGEEEETFWALVCLMEDYALSGFYQEGFPGLQRWLCGFTALLAHASPELASHLVAQGVGPDTFLHQWYLTLFITCLPMPTVLIVWDAIVCLGLEIVLPLAVSMLCALKHVLVEMQFEDILIFLRSFRGGLCGDAVSERLGWLLLRRAEQVVVPPEVRRILGPASASSRRPEVSV